MERSKRYQSLFKEMNKYVIQRNHCSQQILKCGSVFDYDVISSFTDSPTAIKFKVAFEIFEAAHFLLISYPKETVDSEDDCDYLQPAFQGFAEGEMCENQLFYQCVPLKKSMELLNQYLLIRPNDILAEYVKLCFAEMVKSEPREYQRMRHILSVYEKFALKLEKDCCSLDASKDTLLKLRINVNFKLGSYYTITDQNIRALDSFQKAYSYDKTNLDSMYGVAYCQQHFDDDESIKILKLFLEKAPKCHKRYYDAFYTLSMLFASRSDFKTASGYYKLGEQAEGYQLPFLPADIVMFKENARYLLGKHGFVSPLT